jgi:nitrite reductase/ring-hydroxylating ferredoxin subunit
VKVPFTWKITGWFMVGWSPEFPIGEVRPLRYFGEDLVAYRDESGELHVLEAHCKHLGAHIGHGGKLVSDCVQCPFHGWRWGPDGTNRYIPYQPDRPNRALRLRVFPVREQYDCVFIWHQPEGKAPQWEMPDIFGKFPQFETDPAAYYRAPVDDECSDLFYSIWWPRIPGDSSDVPHGELRELIERQFLSTVFDDLEIWRYQEVRGTSTTLQGRRQRVYGAA